MEERKPLLTEEGRHIEQVFSPLNWLQTDIVSLRQEIGCMRQDTEQKLNKLETGLRQEIGGLRQDTEQKLNKLETGLRQDMKIMEAGLRQEMCALRQETKDELVSLRKEIGSLRQWSIATMFTVIIAAAGWVLTMFR